MTQFNKLPAQISNEQLVKMAGRECFDKGQSLLADNARSQVLTQVVIDEERASALVSGFSAQLHYHGPQVEGACSCPASEGFDFCEHCVCLCLFVNKQTQQIRSLAKGPDKSKILAYLLSLDKHELARQCLHLIVEDPNAFEGYLWRAFLHQGDIDYSQLKSQITILTRRPENLFSHRQVKVFFQKMERFLAELVAEDAPEYDPEKMLKVVEYAFQRLNQLLEHVDDSNAHREPSLVHLRQLYRHQFCSLLCREDTQAKRYYQFWISDHFDLLNIPVTDLLPAKAQRKFKTLIEAQWNSLTIVSPTQASSSELKSWQITKLARYLFEEAIQSHDEQQAHYYRHFISKDVNDEQYH